MEHKIYSMDFAGHKLSFEFGRYAEQANGHVIVRLGDTAVMVNACAADMPRDGVDFFPLAVDYEEKQYAVGKIPGVPVRILFVSRGISPIVLEQKTMPSISLFFS